MKTCFLIAIGIILSLRLSATPEANVDSSRLMTIYFTYECTENECFYIYNENQSRLLYKSKRVTPGTTVIDSLKIIPDSTILFGTSLRFQIIQRDLRKKRNNISSIAFRAQYLEGYPFLWMDAFQIDGQYFFLSSYSREPMRFMTCGTGGGK